MRALPVVVAAIVALGTVACSGGQPGPAGTTTTAPSSSHRVDLCLDLQAFNEAVGPAFDQEIRDLRTKGDTPEQRAAITASVEGMAVDPATLSIRLPAEYASDLRTVTAAAAAAKARLAAGVPELDAISPLTSPTASSARSLLIAVSPEC
ncbi:hypothetical protein QRX50_23820 [Amycolatopsis carbonis]|uniref:Uncharacterized protein n=1 Tax=Amycolatopsis carbonis TaxID=715471 RepID=A0A9Y2IQI1_9PSEU|nr:hypothetical protein [Amycolatopsis sp. 2-15]WIX83566.1 hypothetical protein QRX50_23820 [Amycolatopsis sp. 2-15]